MIRVFPRKTKMTPDDEKVYFTGPPMEQLEDREVHVSVTFIEDKPRAEVLADLWRTLCYNVKIGGPAYNDRGSDFVPGRYVKHGAVITSRGCNNNCWFCKVHDREGDIRELNIEDGYNVLDSNLLQCSDDHIKSVFAMLKRQPQGTLFTGGLEAKSLKGWHCDHIAELRLKRMFFAYDTPDDWEPLVEASKKLVAAGMKMNRQKMFCYVLIGYPKDTKKQAEKRLRDVKRLGFCPFAMLYQDFTQDRPEWDRFQRKWCSPAIIFKSKKKKSKTLFDGENHDTEKRNT